MFLLQSTLSQDVYPLQLKFHADLNNKAIQDLISLSLYSELERPRKNRKYTHKSIYLRVTKTKLLICSVTYSFHSSIFYVPGTMLVAKAFWVDWAEGISASNYQWRAHELGPARASSGLSVLLLCVRTEVSGILWSMPDFFWALHSHCYSRTLARL